MISAEQQRRDRHQKQSVAEVRLELVPSTSSKNDLLGIGVDAKAEDNVEPMQRADGWLPVVLIQPPRE
jgi:hypothetical protein